MKNIFKLMVLTTMLLTCFNIQAQVRLNGGLNLSNLSYHSDFGGDDFGKVKLGFFAGLRKDIK